MIQTGCKYPSLHNLDVDALDIPHVQLVDKYPSPDLRPTVVRWLYLKERYERWRAACAVAAFMIEELINPKRIFAHLFEYKDVGHPHKHAMLDSMEQAFFGQPITRAKEPDSRLAFWRLVQLHDEGLVPSDLASPYNCEMGVEEELKAMRAFDKYYAGKTTSDPQVAKERSIRKAEARLGMPHNPILSEEQAVIVRGWAQLYLKAGYLSTDVCCINVEGLLVQNTYLSKPQTPARDGSHRAQDGWLPLRYWSRYGLKSVRDVLELGGMPNTQLPHAHVEDPKEGEHRGVAGRNAEKKRTKLASEMFELWPLAHRPAIELIAESLNMGYRHPTHMPSGKDIDAKELALFGKVLTTGDDRARQLYWLRLYRNYRAWQLDRGRACKTTMDMHAMETTVSAIGWVLQGADPEHLSALVGYGRGGVSRPRPVREVATDHHLYMPLRAYLTHHTWDDPEAESPYELVAF